MKFTVTIRQDIEADSAEDAAREADRLLMTTKPKAFDVTHLRKTVFVLVDRGEAKRIA